MKKAVIFFDSIGITPPLISQEHTNIDEKGDELNLRLVSAAEYQHFDFPRKNIILNRGAIADFKNPLGRKVVVEEVLSENDGITQAVLERKDGYNFFRFRPVVTADIEKALANGERKMSKTKQAD